MVNTKEGLIKSSNKTKSEYLVIFLFFLADSMLVKQNSSLLINQSANIIITSITAVLLFSRLMKNARFSMKQIFFGLFVPLFILMSTFINYLRFDIISAGAFIKIILIIFGLLITERIEFKEFSNSFIIAVSALAFFSMIAYVLSLLFWSNLGSLISKFPIISRQGYMTFYSLFVTNIPTYVSDRWRNWSIFAEPGEFQIYLNIALILLLFFQNDIKKRNIIFIILSLAIITTLSTTAYILYAWIVLGHYIINSTGKIKCSQVTLFLTMLAISISIFQQDKLVEIVFGKFSGGLSNRSFGDRINSFFFNFEILKQYPLLGVGPEQFSIYQLQADYIGAVTNTILGTFSIYGFIPGISFVYIIILFTLKQSKNIIVFIWLMVVFIVMLSTQEMTYSPLINVIFLWGIKPHRKLNLLYKKEN